MKRLIDIAISGLGLLLLAPLYCAIAVAVWVEDGGSPWFRGVRVARGGGGFRMLKFRSMRPDAWMSGVNSTAAGDPRITPVGKFLRASKLDELPQLWNVLKGEMSLVGPRPQVAAEVALYTEEEVRMLEVRPGITDLASIVFADEGEILEGSADPDLLYNQIIRPWKSRLALLYVDRGCWSTDVCILAWTAAAVVSRPWALRRVVKLLKSWGAGEPLLGIAGRGAPLTAYAPLGMTRAKSA